MTKSTSSVACPVGEAGPRRGRAETEAGRENCSRVLQVLSPREDTTVEFGCGTTSATTAYVSGGAFRKMVTRAVPEGERLKAVGPPFEPRGGPA